MKTVEKLFIDCIGCNKRVMVTPQKNEKDKWEARCPRSNCNEINILSNFEYENKTKKKRGIYFVNL